MEHVLHSTCKKSEIAKLYFFITSFQFCLDKQTNKAKFEITECEVTLIESESSHCVHLWLRSIFEHVSAGFVSGQISTPNSSVSQNLSGYGQESVISADLLMDFHSSHKFHIC